MAEVGTYTNWIKKDKDETWVNFTRREDERINSLMDAGLESYKKTGSVLRCVLSFPYADGRAFYIVTNTKPLTLNPIPFGDGYRLPAWQLRGLLIADIKRMLDQQIALDNLLEGGL